MWKTQGFLHEIKRGVWKNTRGQTNAYITSALSTAILATKTHKYWVDRMISMCFLSTYHHQIVHGILCFCEGKTTRGRLSVCKSY